jgi:hypothetical protein
MSNDGSFQPNFVCFTNNEVVRQEPIGGRFKGNQSNEFKFVQFANGSGGLEKRMVDWVGNKTGRTYRAEILAAQEFLASRVGEVMNAPVRDCRFIGGDAKSIVMPYIEGSSGAEINLDIPDNPQGTALVLFDYLVANADRRPKNIIFTPDNRIVGIDHALCNFRPRVPSPALVLRLWQGGVDIAFLEALRPEFEALEPMFSSVGMADKHANLMGNHDKLVKVLKTVSALATIKKESRLHFSKGEALTPPQGVQDAAERALGWLKEGLAGDGFTPVGRKRASDLAHGHAISLETIKRMKAYFDRHEVDKKAEGFQQGEDGYPSPGRVAWDAWGGDAGYSWAESIMEREIKKEEEGHEFRGNQHTGGIAGMGGSDSKGGGESKDDGGSKGSGPAPRQSDPGRNQVSADRWTVVPEAPKGEAPKDEAPKDGKKDETATEEDKDKPATAEVGSKEWAEANVQMLLKGETPVIAPEDLMSFYLHVADMPPFPEADSTEINAGQGPKGTLMGDEGVGRLNDEPVERIKMPQFDGVDQKREFCTELKEKLGVTFEEVSVDPTTLSPFQKEMSTVKIAAFVKQNPTGMPDSRRIVISSDGIVIDGHHNWAAAVALFAGLDSHPKLPIFRVNMTAAELIPLGKKFMDGKGTEAKAMGKSVLPHIVRKFFPTVVIEKAKAGNTEKAVKTILEMCARYEHKRSKKKKALGSVAKGDFDGHPFRGNQYTEGFGSPCPIYNEFKDESSPNYRIHDFINGELTNKAQTLAAETGLWSDNPAAIVKNYVSHTIAERITASGAKIPHWNIPERNHLMVSGKFSPPFDQRFTNEDIWRMGSRYNQTTLESEQYLEYLGKQSDIDAAKELGDTYNPDEFIKGDHPGLQDDAKREFDQNIANGRAELVSQVISRWAMTSNDSDEAALHIQDLAKDMFNLHGTETWNRGEAYEGDSTELFKAVLQAQYDTTQKMFADMGITELKVYRGFQFSPDSKPEWAKDGEATIPLRPLSAFSYDLQEANNFAGSHSGSVVIATTIPVSQILSSAGSGFGCLGENELVVLGGKVNATVGIRGTVDVSQPNIPKFSDAAYNLIQASGVLSNKSVDAVMKGDVDGHPFHGNQWTHGSAEGASMTGEQVKSVAYSPEVIDVFNRIMAKRGFDPYPRNDPLFGGCGVVMKALQNIYPNGKPVAIGTPIEPEEGKNYPPVFVQHYAVQIGEDKFVDGGGEKTLDDIKGMSPFGRIGKGWQVFPATKEVVEAFASISTCTDQEAKDYANAMLKSTGVDTVVKGDLMGHLFHGNQHMTAEEHSVEADKAGKEAEIHEREAARLEAEGKNTQAVVHGFKSVALRREEARHRGLSQER